MRLQQVRMKVKLMLFLIRFNLYSGCKINNYYYYLFYFLYFRVLRRPADNRLDDACFDIDFNGGNDFIDKGAEVGIDKGTGSAGKGVFDFL